MQITAAALNQVAAMLNTTDKNLVISVAIKTLMDHGGMTVEQAMDAVLGEGAYSKLAGNVYDSLRAA